MELEAPTERAQLGVGTAVSEVQTAAALGECGAVSAGPRKEVSAHGLSHSWFF